MMSHSYILWRWRVTYKSNALRFVTCLFLALLLGIASLTGGMPVARAADDSAAKPEPTPPPLPIAKQKLSFSELAPTTTMSFAELVGDNGLYQDETEIPPIPAPDTYKLVINEYFQFATVYKRDAGGAYTVPVRYIIVSSGMGKTPTPRGTFEMGSDYVRFGKFIAYGVYGQYWRQIVRNIYCHSLIYSSRNAKSYTSSYGELGKRASHGCVRMLVPDARWIYYNLGSGTICEIVKGDKNDPAAAAIKKQLVFPKKPGSRPNLKPGRIPVTEAWPGWQGNAYAVYQSSIAQKESEDQEANGKA
jgi:lipoprotein-anchoring transpeptidase ErfK/SrfK